MHGFENSDASRMFAVQLAFSVPPAFVPQRLHESNTRNCELLVLVSQLVGHITRVVELAKCEFLSDGAVLSSEVACVKRGIGRIVWWSVTSILFFLDRCDLSLCWFS